MIHNNNDCVNARSRQLSHAKQLQVPISLICYLLLTIVNTEKGQGSYACISRCFQALFHSDVLVFNIKQIDYVIYYFLYVNRCEGQRIFFSI